MAISDNRQNPSSQSLTQQQTIQSILQSEVACVNSLLQSLELEYEALAEHHADALEEVVRSKQEKIQQLESITRQREQLLVGYDNNSTQQDQDESRRYQFNGNKQLNALWDELIVAAEKCRDKNRVNGSIVESISRQSRHALDIIQGIVPGANATSELYDHSGQTRAYASKRTLVHV